MAQRLSGKRAAAIDGIFERVTDMIRPHKPRLAARAALAGNHVQAGTVWQFQRRVDTDPDDDVLPRQLQRGRQTAAFDPTVAAVDPPCAGDAVVQAQASSGPGWQAIVLQQFQAAGDQLPRGAEVQEMALRQHPHQKGMGDSAACPPASCSPDQAEPLAPQAVR